MCRILGLSRQSYYYQSKPKKDESELEEVVAEEFIRSRKAYGSRKIKKALSKRGIQISRRKISRIMKNRGLKSSYTVAYFKVHHSTCNEAKTTNVLNRKFLRDNPLEAITFETLQQLDLELFDYVNWWNHLRLHGTLGYETPVGYRNQRLAQRILDNELGCANAIFATDRGKEFDNQAIDELLTTFDINRSLSHKGCPFDNAVAESTYKSLKVEFVYQYTFETLQQLDLELFDYVNWWNHLRLHGTLGYETPVGYRNQRLAQRILDNELGCANASEAV
ncbi:transposase (plasmid) [Enterococcus faecium]|nr:transposase [Enterococcus faecium]